MAPVSSRRSLARMLVAATALSLALPLVGQAQAQTATPVVPAAPALTEAQLMEVAPELFGFLKSNFPQEFTAFVPQAQAAVAGGATLDGVVMDLLGGLRQKYGSSLGTAPDNLLTALMTTTIDLQKAVFEGEGALACSNFAINGPAVFDGTPAQAKYQDLVMAQSVLLLAAAKAGFDAPVARDAASQDDWKVITDLTMQAGATQAGFEAISKLDVASPELCPTLRGLLEAMNTEATGVGARVRAAYLVSVSAM
ncbi:hypothetical protein [Devosia sp. FKR38]|uniref:hypothetical protein n=1 Tax=Devosia sp. FKR38 TaxID=2562312 RepID=UPI0010C006D0|nr:hypothetical protein [Devosia sp. FKR38]